MKKTHVALIPILCSFLSACFGFEPFQPNPPEFQNWSKPGVSQLAVKKAMLECGYPTPFEVTSGRAPATPQDIALMHICMASDGFVYEQGRYDFCDHWKELKACQPGASIPKRDIDKRLNGRFCRAHPDIDLCQR